MTGLVHWFLLRPLSTLVGVEAVGDVLVHVAVPVLTVIGWLVFGPRPRIDGRTVAWSLAWPIGWLVYTLVVGALTGWYPYPFLDVAARGVGPVAITCGAIAAAARRAGLGLLAVGPGAAGSAHAGRAVVRAGDGLSDCLRWVRRSAPCSITFRNPMRRCRRQRPLLRRSCSPRSVAPASWTSARSSATASVIQARLLARLHRHREGFRESHLAFAAPDRACVRAFFVAAGVSGRRCCTSPGCGPSTTPNYYGGFVRDPDGNNVEAACHSPRMTPVHPAHAP